MSDDSIREEDVQEMVRIIMRELVRGADNNAIRISALIMNLATNWVACGYTPDQAAVLVGVALAKAKASPVLQALAMAGRN